jgi:molecular chaperone IbpA
MRSFDFAPYYRSTVGFDRLFSMLDQVGGVEASAPSYPPYNIARTGENDYRISVAVAGFTDAVQVKGASLENGLLHIDLVREIPEAMKPRAIPIASSSKVLEVQPTKLAA